MSSSFFNRNPSGANQHGSCPTVDDPNFVTKLTTLFRENLGDQKIADRFQAEFGIKISASTIKRRRQQLGLHGSKSQAVQNMPAQMKEQIILKQVDKDPAQNQGPATIKARINWDQNIRLPRSLVSSVMRTHNPDGFLQRGPNSKQILRFPKTPAGINERWSGDGHDKLKKIGFPVWAVVDDATGKWLGAWVIPCNRLSDIVGYLFLDLVETVGGLPVEFTTDCGSETVQVYGLANALREAMSDLPNDILPAHRYVRSVHNIGIERAWLRLRLTFGDNACLTYEKGKTDGIYDEGNRDHFTLCQWLWSKFLREQLSEYVSFTNAMRMRKDKDKAGPSGDSRNNMYLMPEKWGGKDYLQPLTDSNIKTIRELKKAIGGPELIQFVTPSYATRAEEVYKSLDIVELSYDNVWTVFKHMSNIMYPA